MHRQHRIRRLIAMLDGINAAINGGLDGNGGRRVLPQDASAVCGTDNRNDLSRVMTRCHRLPRS
jgi:hypothetical protein